MRIDFYILSDDTPTARELFCCRIAEKAYRMGHRIYVLTDSDSQARRVDDLLWTFRDGSFVPHARAAGHADPPPPVLIGSGEDPPPPTADVLINLATAVPASFRQFARIAEIVDPAGRASGRERFRFYRAEGLQPNSHEAG